MRLGAMMHAVLVVNSFALLYDALSLLDSEHGCLREIIFDIVCARIHVRHLS